MPKTLEAAPEELPIDKKARYSRNFINSAGEEKVKKYANLDQPGNFKNIIEQAESIAGVKFKNIEITGYSQGGFGIKAFAAQKGKRVEVAIGKRSAYSEAYFKGSSPIHVHFNKSAEHGAMLGIHMSKSLASGEGQI